ncbi:MAG TPA: nitroreductase family protein [Thermomicrobiales bacterium]|nr:nitroreductase family protein [Thermomicrobiales bacterium]
MFGSVLFCREPAIFAGNTREQGNDSPICRALTDWRGPMNPGDDTLPLLGPIVDRYSSRRFAATPLATEIVETLLEAARWAPSYGNRQPTRYIVASHPETLAAVHEALTRGNAYLRAAPVLIAVCGRPEDAQIVDGKEYYLLDAGLGIENLLLQAFAMDLHAHSVGGFDEGKVRAAFGIPEDVRVLALVGIGHAGRLEDLDERTLERELRERTRKPREEVRAWERWSW